MHKSALLVAIPLLGVLLLVLFLLGLLFFVCLFVFLGLLVCFSGLFGVFGFLTGIAYFEANTDHAGSNESSEKRENRRVRDGLVKMTAKAAALRAHSESAQ